jgi:hypothetical protein
VFSGRFRVLKKINALKPSWRYGIRKLLETRKIF